ncbi:MAG: hypothetical protein HKN77_06570 [Woeseiaceae bacterium]|nr:hypothetical protein [Woeseiaceae bacterium]
MGPIRGSTVYLAVVLVFLMPGVSHSGDEVDYSAPYITVENGELVTKYPAKTHADGGEIAAPSDSPVELVDERNLRPALLVAGVVAFLLLFLMFRRRLKV